MALDKKVNEEIIENAEKFLKGKGHDNLKRVNLTIFAEYSVRGDFIRDEPNRTEDVEMKFDGVYGITKKGECIYAAILTE